MKKIYALLSAALMVFSFSSCEDFLTETAKSSLTPENSFTTAKDWNKALNSSYAMLQKVFAEKYTIILNEFGTDEVQPFDLGWAFYSELMYGTYNAEHEALRCH